jgi:S-adenosyl methyltransferase
VLAHARALLTSSPAGTVEYIDSDLRDPGKVIGAARGFLDFTKPIALLLVAVLHFIPDTDDPQRIIAFYRDALPRGSYLVLSHGTTDFHPPEVTDTATSAYESGPAPLVLRPKAAIEALFGGFTLEPPGLVQPPLWHPEDGEKPKPDGLNKIGVYAWVAAKN